MAAVYSYESIHPSNLRGDTYIHQSGYEHTSPGVVHDVLLTHAIGYSQDMGFVSERALGEDGYILPDIDKARGPNVEYHLATDPIDARNKAAMRIIHLAESQSIEDLPAYSLTKDALTVEGEAILRSVESKKLKELAGLSKTGRGASRGLFEIIRKTIQESIGKDETWFFAIVSNTHESLARKLGARSFEVLGEDVPIDDERVDSSQVRLRPVVFRPDRLFSTMHNSIVEATSGRSDETSIKQQSRLSESLLYFTEGIEPSKVDPEIYGWRRDIVNFLGNAAVNG